MAETNRGWRTLESNRAPRDHLYLPPRRLRRPSQPLARYTQQHAVGQPYVGRKPPGGWKRKCESGTLCCETFQLMLACRLNTLPHPKRIMVPNMTLRAVSVRSARHAAYMRRIQIPYSMTRHNMSGQAE